MSEAGRFLICLFVNQKVGSDAGQKRIKIQTRRIGNFGRRQRLVYLLLDEGHQVGDPIPLHWFQIQQIRIGSQGRIGKHLSL